MLSAFCVLRKHSIARRTQLGLDEIRRRILSRDMTFSDAPDFTLWQKIWPHNLFLGRDLEGDLLRFERWGSIDVTQLLGFSPEDMVQYFAWLLVRVLCVVVVVVVDFYTLLLLVL